ncbi:unnamed protein product [Peniophora sp. CBMAI 1063]|nr:unnamed protein product [Peniophora sp. CBMAI 1063]
MAVEDFDHHSREVMLAFYRRLYPFKSIYRWLNHEHAATRLFTHREIAYSLPGDIYIRYKSFNGPEDFKKETLSYNPERFEIGPVYSVKPKDRKTLAGAKLVPEKRELVFDIDMTDYDEIRTCCKDAAICNRCWAFITAAVKVLDHSIREQFGWKHLLWVYSGRRGIHCWVSDPEAMALTDEQRRALVGWMTVVKGGKEMSKKVNVRPPGYGPGGSPWPLPPAVKDCLPILSDVFSTLILEDQNLFERDEHWEELLNLIPDKELVKELRISWNDDEGKHSIDKWAELQAVISRTTEKGTVERAQMKALLEDIILQYTYPRIDAEVSKKRNHLLKAPFVVHPKTGRVCVPVDPAHVDEFNPETVPTVAQLLSELEANHAEGSEEQDDWERTSLKPYVQFLDAHVKGIMEDVRKAKMATSSMDW